MTIGLFFILLAVLLVIALPVGGVFGLMSYTVSDRHCSESHIDQ